MKELVVSEHFYRTASIRSCPDGHLLGLNNKGNNAKIDYLYRFAWANGDCRGICGRLCDSHGKDEITQRQMFAISNYILKLPNFYGDYKFPTDKTGFLLRAKWLEKLSKKFK